MSSVDAEALREYRRYCQHFTDERVVERVHGALTGIGDRNLLADEQGPELWRRVRQHVLSKSPFSLIRLGDGEGNLLFWGRRRRQFPVLAEQCMAAIWAIMFGNQPYGDDAWSRVFEQMTRAVADADYLGIPNARVIHRSLQEGGRDIDLENRPVDIRGASGPLSVWDYLVHPASAGVFDSTTVTHSFIHTWSSTHLADVISSAGNISVISCHTEALGILTSARRVAKGRMYPIPPQAANIGGTPDERHFPDRYEELDADLARRDLSGQLFFVAAGLLGKLYCGRIKRQGGMAVDVGSTMDVWVGKSVRAYQTEDYVAESIATLSDAPPG